MGTDLGRHVQRLEQENAKLRRQVVELLAVVKDLAEALIETTNTLESVDPNAPSLELANEVIEKHVQVIGPLIEEARRGREATDETAE